MKLTITLTKDSEGLYSPITNLDAYGLQHCMNEDLSAVNETGLLKLKIVAGLHDWEVKIEADEVNYEP